MPPTIFSINTVRLCCKKEADLVQLGKSRTKRIYDDRTPSAWRHFQADIIRMSCSLVSPLCTQLPRPRRNDMGTGTLCDHTTISRWVQHYAPELEKRCRPHLKATNDSWRVDETSIKVKKCRLNQLRGLP